MEVVFFLFTLPNERYYTLLCKYNNSYKLYTSRPELLLFISSFNHTMKILSCCAIYYKVIELKVLEMNTDGLV